MEFLSIGEKLKKLRKQLKMNQEDLSDTNMTRSFISMIEIGKRTPNRHNAEIIVNKFRKRANELGVILDIDDSYLSRDAREEAEFYCILKLQGSNLADDIDNIIKIGNEYNLYKILADSYIYLGDTAFQDKDYTNAFINYINALDYYKSIDVINKYPYLYNMLGRCKSNQIQHTEALAYFNLANHHALLQNDYDIRKKSVYNMAVCNKKLGRIADSLTCIDLYLSICDKDQDFTVYIYSNILKSNCYMTNKLFDKSICLLNSLLKHFNDISNPLLGFIYNNLGIIYFKKGIIDRSIEYFDISEKIRATVDKPALCRTIIERASVYIEQNLYEQALSQLKYGLDLATTSNDIEYQVKAYYALGDLYMHLDLLHDAKSMYLKLLTILDQNKPEYYKNDIINIYVKLSFIYLEQNDTDSLKENLSKLQNITIM